MQAPQGEPGTPGDDRQETREGTAPAACQTEGLEARVPKENREPRRAVVAHTPGRALSPPSS